MADHQRTRQQQQQQQQPQQQAQYQSPTDAIKGLPEKGPSAHQFLAVLTLFPLGGFLLLLAGLTFAGTIVGLAVSAPLFVIFSPVLVPAAIVIAGAVAGFLTSGAFGITGLSSLSWLASYLRRIKTASLPEKAERARRRVQDTAGYLGQKPRESGQVIQTKAQEGGRGGGAGVGQESGGRPSQEGGRAQESAKAQEGTKI